MNATYSKPRPSLSPAYCCWLALTAAVTDASVKPPPSCDGEQVRTRAIAPPADTSWLQDESADTSVAIQLAAEEKMAILLSHAGYKATRQGKTEDGSMLFQFLGSTQACVDVYPTGEVVVIVRNGEVDEVHPFEVSDGKEILDVLAHALPSSVPA